MLDTTQFDPLSPKQLEDIVANTETWSETAKLIHENRASHIVLIGPAGCGKSTFLRIALKKFPTLVIDCTANFGLRENRDMIRLFARGSRNADGNMRWIVLEHADSLTADTQAFLRRMLETTSATTRFVFECKDGGAITEPIYSRSSIVTVNMPDDTDMVYEIQRRTTFQLAKSDIDNIVKTSYGNLRHALMQALAKLYAYDSQWGQGMEIVQTLLSERPVHCVDSGAWIQWALSTDSICHLEGIDLRDILRIGWPHNTTVSNTCAQWSRLGGTSPRALFFDCVSRICGKTQ